MDGLVASGTINTPLEQWNTRRKGPDWKLYSTAPWKIWLFVSSRSASRKKPRLVLVLTWGLSRSWSAQVRLIDIVHESVERYETVVCVNRGTDSCRSQVLSWNSFQSILFKFIYYFISNRECMQSIVCTVAQSEKRAREEWENIADRLMKRITLKEC